MRDMQNTYEQPADHAAAQSKSSSGRPSVLLVAYQCGPGMGSVSQIGWEWYARLREHCDVTLVTHVRNRAALERACPVGDVMYIDTEWFAGPLYRLARRMFPLSEHSVFLISSLDYFLFDLTAYRQLRQKLAAGANWQIVHRVTPVTLAAPTWLGRLGLPLIVGPLNCGLGMPGGFDYILRQESTWLVRLRRIGRVIDTLIGSSRRISRILTATRATRDWVAPRFRDRCRMMLENGIDLARFQPAPWPEAPSASQPLRVLFVGRLIAFKGLDLLLAAMARLKGEGRRVNLEVIGDGPMYQRWQQLTSELGLDGEVQFSGAQPAGEVARRLCESHVLCLPSVRESGGAVLLEAMASARPAIALAYGGPAEIVDDEVGALIPLVSPEQVIADLTQSLRSLFADAAHWRRRGENGRRRIERNFSWPAKIASAGALYDELIKESPAHA